MDSPPDSRRRTRPDLDPRVGLGLHFSLEDPSDFADCIGESASVMTGCIFNGLAAGSPVGDCAP